MATNTPNFNLIKPGVNDPTDQDLWGGMLNSNFDIIDSVMESCRLPVGSCYINFDDATNPSILLGYGTWVAISQGRNIIGVGSGTDINGTVENFSVNTTGGEYEHSLTIPELPEHDHAPPSGSGFYIDGSYIVGAGSGGPGFAFTSRTGKAGGNQAHNNVSPYVTAYIWRRSA